VGIDVGTILERYFSGSVKKRLDFSGGSNTFCQLLFANSTRIEEKGVCTSTLCV
jgi:hypothetical protein